MNKYGFYITDLKVTGENKKDAEISFKDGFNLISGFSDTGKSYVFGCLNYMLGKSDSPKSIPEGIGYNNFYLSIKTYDGKSYTFYRKLKAKVILIKECVINEFDDSNIKYEEYQIKPQADKNISTFLLKLNGIEDKYLKKSNSSKVRLLYTYIRKLVLISETRIVVEESPFYPTSQFQDSVLYQNLLIYLISGKDAQNFTPIEKDDIRKSRLNGQKEIIEKRIESLSQQIEELIDTQKPVDKIRIERDLNRLEEEAQNLDQVINSLLTTRNSIYQDLEKTKSSILFIQELLDRMELLRSHYKSDLNRLSFIDEGQILLSQLKSVNCPLCNGEIDSEKLQEIDENISIKKSIDSERKKINLKLIDLDSTVNENKKELIRLDSELRIDSSEFENINKEICDSLNPKLDSIRDKISNIKEYYTQKSKYDLFVKDLELYNNEYDNTIRLLKIKQTVETTEEIDEIIMKPFIGILKSILKDWRYPNTEFVKFDSNPKVFDFVLTNKGRSSFGKGMRAISYTAVIYSLIQYCIDNNIPFTRNLIIDSPLTTYHGKEQKTKEDEIDVNIEHSFFKHFAYKDLDFQFIMFDNKVPPVDTIKNIHYIEFTGEIGNNRFGFFPVD
jgi:hypothetical protein